MYINIYHLSIDFYPFTDKIQQRFCNLKNLHLVSTHCMYIENVTQNISIINNL